MSYKVNEASVPVTLVSQIAEQNLVQLERYVTVGGNDVRRRAKAPTIADEALPELALYVYQEFMDIAGQSRLSLTTGVTRFEFFRQVLMGTARSHWDAATAEVAGTNLDHFDEAVDIWLSKYMEPTAYHDQKLYLSTASKPYQMNCKQLYSRLVKIKTLMPFMPGAPDVDQVLPNMEFKMCYFQLMPGKWRSSFDAAGHNITLDTYTIDNLVAYMAAQERQEMAQRGGSRRGGRAAGRRSSQPGRGHSRGSSRSYGRSGGYQPYQYRPLPSQYSPYRPSPQRARYDSYRPPQGRGYFSGGSPRHPQAEQARGRTFRGSPRFFTPRAGARTPARYMGRSQPVQLFGREQHAMYHVEHEAEQQEPGSEDQYETSEAHWAEEQFGVFEEQYYPEEQHHDDQYGEY